MLIEINKRNYTIDTLRTIATLLVILLHVSSEYVTNGKDNLSFDMSFWIGNIVQSFTRICVPIFILISGAFLLGRNETIKQSYQKRAYRILIPIVAWTLIYLVYRILLSFAAGHSIEIKSLLQSVVLGKPFYHMWYLYMIIGLYLITPFINNSIFNKSFSIISNKGLWIFALILLIFGMINSVYDNILGNKVLFIFWFTNYLGYFILGYLIKSYNKNFSLGILFSTYAVSGFLIAILSFYTNKYFNNLYFYGYVTPFVIIGSLSVYKLFHQLNLTENILSKISHLTLGIYLIHAGILHVMNLGIQELKLQFFENAFIGIPIKFALTLSMSIIIAVLISRTKYLNKII